MEDYCRDPCDRSVCFAIIYLRLIPDLCGGVLDARVALEIASFSALFKAFKVREYMLDRNQGLP
jgi:hypothetical protein